jgi:4-diphosphocytidyl-2-C-methyl-D-erythritol kinase
MTLLKARAKINLFFQIIGKRDDGYHLIESLVVFADDIYDIIEVTPNKINSTKVIAGDFAHLLESEQNNLINKAFNIFYYEDKYLCQLTKNIPIGAGLGGGSSDAAMVAKFLNNKQLNINKELTDIGADLPVCYYDAPAFCSGIGGDVELVANFPTLHLVLVNPNKTLLTPAVFKNNLQINTSSIAPYPSDFQNDLEKLIEFLKPLNNDLTISAIELMPEIQAIMDLLSFQEGCVISRMSGSGPTCFGVFENKEAAIKASEAISNLKPDYWVRYTKV